MDRGRKIMRTELYNRVWAVPMQKLAVEFGLSGRGLAKLCERHQIPVPGRGYWARLQFGQKPARTQLPKSMNIGLDTIAIIPHEKRPSEIPRPSADQPVPQIEISENRPLTHRHVLRVDKSILRGRADERGLPFARKGRILPLHVSLESLPRTLRILDTLFSVLDSSGYCINWNSPYTSPLNVIVLDEKIGLSITEIIERKEHIITKEEAYRQKADNWWRPPKWEYSPTGRLKFLLHSTEASHLQHTWTDRKKQTIEHCLGEIFVSFEITAKSVKQYREDCVLAARVRAEEQKKSRRTSTPAGARI